MADVENGDVSAPVLVYGTVYIFRRIAERKDGLAEPPDATVSVVSGMVENSNVNVVNEMTEILAIAREFEIQLRMMQTAEQNDEAASELLRSS